MPKFNVEVEFDLNTSVEFDGGFGFEYSSGVEIEDYEENVPYSGKSVAVYGASVSFVVEADDEYDAERKASDVVYEGQDVEDGNGFIWIAESVSITVEEVEEPMTLERAIELLKAMFERMGFSASAEEQEAFSFLLNHIAALAVKAAEPKVVTLDPQAVQQQ